MHVYDTLRDELVADPLTEGQPQVAAEHLKRVGQDALGPVSGSLLIKFSHWADGCSAGRCWTTTCLAAS